MLNKRDWVVDATAKAYHTVCRAGGVKRSTAGRTVVKNKNNILRGSGWQTVYQNFTLISYHGWRRGCLGPKQEKFLIKKQKAKTKLHTPTTKIGVLFTVQTFPVNNRHIK